MKLGAVKSYRCQFFNPSGTWRQIALPNLDGALNTLELRNREELSRPPYGLRQTRGAVHRRDQVWSWDNETLLSGYRANRPVWTLKQSAHRTNRKSRKEAQIAEIADNG